MRKMTLLSLLPSVGKGHGPGPSSLYKKPESFEGQFQNLQVEESTDLSPTVLLFTSLETAASTEEPPALPATSLRPQVKVHLLNTLAPTAAL